MHGCKDIMSYMARFNEKMIPYVTQDRLMSQFCEMLSRLKTSEHIRNFLKDLLNRQERLMLIRRLHIAELLEQGMNYRDIKKQLHCGCATIARVERWLSFGRGGYKKAIDLRRKSS